MLLRSRFCRFLIAEDNCVAFERILQRPFENFCIAQGLNLSAFVFSSTFRVLITMHALGFHRFHNTNVLISIWNEDVSVCY